MKAPKLSHQFLVDHNFRFARGEYLGVIEDAPLLKRIRLDRIEADSAAITVDVAYPFGASAGAISPLELSVMANDGCLWRTAPSDKALLIDPEDEAAIAAAIERAVDIWIVRFGDGRLMVGLWKFLIGEGECPDEFRHLLSWPYLARRRTPMAMRSLAAYHNVLGNFDLAMDVMGSTEMLPWLPQPMENKIKTDAQHRRIDFPAALQERLQKGKVPFSLSGK